MSAATITMPEITSVEQARGLVTHLFNQLQQSQWRIAQLEKQLYGQSSERKGGEEDELSKEQILLSLFPKSEEPPATEQVLVPATKEKELRPRRQFAIKTLETETQRLEPAEKVCPHCGKDKCEIGCETSERFKYIAAKVVRIEIVRPKLACKCGQAGVSIAPLPPSLVPQGCADVSLIVQVIVAKFLDHLPLYRQQQMFARLGVNFPKSTMGDWVTQAANWLEPIVREMKRELLAGDYLQADETPVNVMDPDVQGKTVKGYLWVMGLPRDNVVFEFHRGRGKEEAKQLLDGFKGYLQRDGYSAYSSLVDELGEKLIPVGCWAHARRKFIEAELAHPTHAPPFIGKLRKLYVVEAVAREQKLDPEQRKALRDKESKPILDDLLPELEQAVAQNLPQSPLAKAAKYCLNEWTALNKYLEDGRLEIDNNLTENAIRPTAVGKKNWLFIGHPEAGWRSAVIYSVIVSCQRRGIDPSQYLTDVLSRLPSMKHSELTTLLPQNWKPARVSVSP
jgi:transposase